jgi:hypothetical protein
MYYEKTTFIIGKVNNLLSFKKYYIVKVEEKNDLIGKYLRITNDFIDIYLSNVAIYE